MATYNDLKPGYYYIIKEHENATIDLVYVPMETNKCILIEYQDEEQSMNWYKKTDEIYELVEQLTEEQALIFEGLTDPENDEDDLNWSEEIDNNNDWFSPDLDEGDDEEKRRAINN